MRLDLRPYLSRGAEIRAHSPLAQEVQEPCFDDACDSLGTAGFRKAVRGSVDLYKFSAARYQLDCCFQFVNGAKDIPGSADEQGWRSKFGKMSGSQLGRLSRRMERVGEQQ